MLFFYGVDIKLFLFYFELTFHHLLVKATNKNIKALVSIKVGV